MMCVPFNVEYMVGVEWVLGSRGLDECPDPVGHKHVVRLVEALA